MSEEIQAAQSLIYASSQILKIVVDSSVVMLRFSGKATQQLVASALAHLKSSSQKETGEISVRAMAKRGEPFDMVAINPADASKFVALAKQTGLLYSIHQDKQDYDKMQVDGLNTVLYRQQDAALVNSIMQRCQINSLGNLQADTYPDASPDMAQAAEVPAAARANTTPEYTDKTIPSMTNTYRDVQQQMQQNLSMPVTQRSESQEKEPNLEVGADDLAKKANSMPPSLTETQNQLSQLMQKHLKPSKKKNKSMEL